MKRISTLFLAAGLIFSLCGAPLAVDLAPEGAKAMEESASSPESSPARPAPPPEAPFSGKRFTPNFGLVPFKFSQNEDERQTRNKIYEGFLRIDDELSLLDKGEKQVLEVRKAVAERMEKTTDPIERRNLEVELSVIDDNIRDIHKSRYRLHIAGEKLQNLENELNEKMKEFEGMDWSAPVEPLPQWK